MVVTHQRSGILFSLIYYRLFNVIVQSGIMGLIIPIISMSHWNVQQLLSILMIIIVCL